MLTENHYHNGLLLLSYLLMASDGEIDDDELAALKRICESENIGLEEMNNFLRYAIVLPEKEVYNKGLNELAECPDDQKIRAFSGFIAYLR